MAFLLRANVLRLLSTQAAPAAATAASTASTAASSATAAAPAAASTLRSRLQTDLKAAMKNRNDKERLTAIRSVVSAVSYADKNSGQTVDDDAIVRELRKLARKHEESIEQFVQMGRADEAEHEKRELGVVNEYLPQQMSNEQIEAMVQQAIGASGAATAKDIGKVMKELDGKFSDSVAPKKTVAEIAKRLLSQRK